MRLEAKHPLLILRLSALGDVIHTIPAVAAIRRSQPGFALGWAVEGVYADLVESVAPVDQVFRVGLRGWRRRPLASSAVRGIAGSIREMRAFARGGTSIDFQGLFKSAILGRLSGARRRVGFEARSAREPHSAWFTNHQVRAEGEHVIEWNFALARSVGASPIDPLSVDYSRFPRDSTGRLALLVHERPVVLLPGAGQARKRWPVERFAELAERIASETGRGVVAVWGPGEESVARELSARTPVVRVAPPTDLRELAFLLRGAACVVGGDTGPLHLAAAMRVRVVGLYGPTNPARNGPWRQEHRCVESWSRGRRMDEIGVSSVMGEVRSVLAETLV